MSVLVLNVGIKFAGAVLGRLLGGNPHRPATFHRCKTEFLDRGAPQIYEGSCHFAPIAEFERAFTKAASGNDSDRIGGTAIDLHKNDKAFSISPVQLSNRIVYSQELAAQHRKADAKYLTCTKMPMRSLGLLKQTHQRFHSMMINRLFFETNCD